MKYVSWMICVCIVALAVPLSLDAGQRIVKQYRIGEQPNRVEQSPYILTLTSGDLNKYPRSVVTVTLSTERGRSISSIAPGQTPAPERLSAKRHYTMMTDDQFGHAGTPEVIFDREAGTVFIGFIGGKEGKTYFFKEISSVRPEVAQHRMPLPGIPDSQ